MECYFIHMFAEIDHTAPHSNGPIFVHFLVYGVVSRQWHHEVWPSNAQLSLCIGITLFFNDAPTSNGVKSQLLGSQLTSSFRLIKRLSNV